MKTLLIFIMLLNAQAFGATINQSGKGTIKDFPEFLKTRSIDSTNSVVKISTDITDTQNKSYMKIGVEINNGLLSNYKETFSTGKAEVTGKAKGKKFILEVRTGKDIDSHEFDLEAKLQVGESMPMYLAEAKNWDAIISGKVVDIEMIVALRGMAISMEASKAEESAGEKNPNKNGLIKVQLEASNFVLRMLGDPSYLWFNPKTRRLVRYEGPLIPLAKLSETDGLPPRGTLTWNDSI